MNRGYSAEAVETNESRETNAKGEQDKDTEEKKEQQQHLMLLLLLLMMVVVAVVAVRLLAETIRLRFLLRSPFSDVRPFSHYAKRPIARIRAEPTSTNPRFPILRSTPDDS